MEVFEEVDCVKQAFWMLVPCISTTAMTDWWGWKQYSINCLHQNIQGDHAYESGLHRYASVTNIQGKVQIYFFLKGVPLGHDSCLPFRSSRIILGCCCCFGGRGLVFFPAWMPVVRHPNFTGLIAHVRCWSFHSYKYDAQVLFKLKVVLTFKTHALLKVLWGGGGEGGGSL